jgi:hypothetical protein
VRLVAGLGLGNPDELWLPLDRSTTLILHSDAQRGERVIRAQRYGDESAAIDDFNQAVVYNARAEVYCHPDDVDRLDGLTFADPELPLLKVSGGGPFATMTTTDGVTLHLDAKGTIATAGLVDGGGGRLGCGVASITGAIHVQRSV